MSRAIARTGPRIGPREERAPPVGTASMQAGFSGDGVQSSNGLEGERFIRLQGLSAVASWKRSGLLVGRFNAKRVGSFNAPMLLLLADDSVDFSRCRSTMGDCFALTGSVRPCVQRRIGDNNGGIKEGGQAVLAEQTTEE